MLDLVGEAMRGGYRDELAMARGTWSAMVVCLRVAM